MLSLLCRRVRPELSALGELGGPLVDVLEVVERAGGTRGLDTLADPGFALDILTAADPSADAAVVGRVLDFLRVRSSAPVAASTSLVQVERVTLATAVERYTVGPLALLAAATQNSYGMWVRRLADTHGDQEPDAITTGDLRDLIAAYVLAVRAKAEKHPRHAGSGSGSEAMAVKAFRNFWRYLVEKGWTSQNVAMDLHKPSEDESQRRPWRADETALIRQFARSHGRDPFLNEVMVTIPERMGLRREEMYKLRICDVDLERLVAQVQGKGGKERESAIPPVLAALLERFIEDRRPADVTADEWRRSEERLLRSRPSVRDPHGQRAGWSRPEAFFDALRKVAPDMFRGRGRDQSLHCYRHALGTWVERNYGRKATKTVLGHRGRKESTDYYIYVPLEEQAEILAAYEQYLLAADPTYRQAA
jgi:integrase